MSESVSGSVSEPMWSAGIGRPGGGPLGGLGGGGGAPTIAAIVSLPEKETETHTLQLTI